MSTSSREPVSRGYLASVVAFVVVAPLVSLAVDRGAGAVFRWFLFWAVGVRLLVAGLRQVLQPSFTAAEIFKLQGREAFPVVRELGFANLCQGLVAALSVGIPSWRIPAAVAGGLYFGVAGALHIEAPRDPQRGDRPRVRRGDLRRDRGVSRDAAALTDRELRAVQLDGLAAHARQLVVGFEVLRLAAAARGAQPRGGAQRADHRLGRDAARP